ncbi:MAG TPA: hypothetical protein VN541_01775 [Tepidisphaeraceae bacterium]|nr:hypothetical protein [Tepidisphaeraceae bacterium]
MRRARAASWIESKIAELEAQIERPVTDLDMECVDINESARTLTVARNPLLSEIRSVETTRFRGKDLPPNPG